MPGPHPQKKATGVEWGLPKCGCVCYRQQRQKDGVSQALWIPDGSITGLKCSGHGARVFVFFCWISAPVFSFGNGNVYSMLLCIGTM